ncbi:flagellar export protein FliJ [Bdellovibrio bacteriovorus]|uniref:flagellar export protein FliJ n=1 Tax=Bdellovibrio bacteriovorus TaxID=959 RepID=UPI0021CFB4D5|nr:flagellar export protein FliJ [Bdellovibrio bacteriovorus]UXR64262.1 flagellar export protein FliJ [Bdellovibrio bacteriovorus]
MKFKFPLQKVLEHRKIKENLAQKDFQEVVTLLNEEQARLDAMLGQVQSAHSQAGSLSQQGGAQGPALSQIHEFLKGQDIRIQRQRQKVQEIEKLVESKREILRQAALEYKIMEKMRENKFEEYRAERLSNDQKEMDEQSILRFKAVKES